MKDLKDQIESSKGIASKHFNSKARTNFIGAVVIATAESTVSYRYEEIIDNSAIKSR